MSKNAMLVMAALASIGAKFNDSGEWHMPKKHNQKPQFTHEELEYLRSLPKKEKRKAVAELQRKYAERK